jgi:hypothetical protein
MVGEKDTSLIGNLNGILMGNIEIMQWYQLPLDTGIRHPNIASSRM